MVENLPEKILQYEEFLNERLRSDLKKVLDLRERVYSDIADYGQLKNTVDMLINERMDTQPLKTMVDLGCNFYAHAKVENCSMIYVSVGLGFHLEMTLEEASAFIEKKISHLTEKAEKLSEDASQINGRIKVIMETLRELQFSSEEPQKSRREIW